MQRGIVTLVKHGAEVNSHIFRPLVRLSIEFLRPHFESK